MPAGGLPADGLRLGGRIDFTATARGLLHGPGPGLGDYELLAYPRAAWVQPPGFPLPLANIGGGSIRLTRGVVSLSNITASYGFDQLFLTSMRLPVADWPGVIQMNDIMGSVDFAQPGVAYPPPLDEPMELLHPAGAYAVAGQVTIDRRQSRVDYRLLVSSDHGSVYPTARRIPVTEIKTDVRLKPDQILVQRFDARALGGTLVATARLRPGQPLIYQADFSLREADLRQLVRVFSDVPESQKFGGRTFLHLALNGAGPTTGRSAADTLEGAGEIEITEGDLWEIPVLKLLLNQIKVGREAITAGNAAALLRIHQRQVALTKAVLNAPVLGLQGSGTVGFDGRLDLMLIAAPLADWKDKLQATRIPVVSDVAGELAGALQNLVNVATRNLLYQFHVTGQVGNPTVATVPAPLLTRDLAWLFGQMLKPAPEPHPLDWLKTPPPDKNQSH